MWTPSAAVTAILLSLVCLGAADSDDCPASEELSVCLKRRLVSGLDRVARLQRLDLGPGLALLRDPGTEPPPAPSSQGMLDSLASSRAAGDKEAVLDTLIADRVASIFDGRYLRIDLSEPTDEGRAKKRRGVNALLMMMLMMASMMLPLKLGALAMLAGKALIISKLALALAAIVGLKKLLGGDDHQDSYQVVQVPAGHGHKRSLDMAYSAYRPS